MNHIITNDDEDTKENITFFLEDTFNDAEDNSFELEKMMHQFQDNDDTNNFNEYNNAINFSEDIKDLSYFIKKDFYCGNNEFYYNEEYKLKDLMKICKYYGIASSVKASKCKKQDIISTIIYFENSQENYDIVEQRHKMWAYMAELLEDPKMRGFLLW
jgi:hypothetical protein